MKYRKTRTWFHIPVRGKPQGALVRPFNGEKPPKRLKMEPDVSWSAGFTHLEHVATGGVSHCGQHWFEKNAVKVAA